MTKYETLRSYFFDEDLEVLTRLKAALKKFILKHINRECIEGVKRISSPYPGTIGFKIRDVGPERDVIYCAFPEWLSSYADDKIWIHEFVEDTNR